jgi:glucokinase
MNVRLGIDLGGSFIKAGIISDSFKVLHRLEVQSGANLGAREVVYNLRNVYKSLHDISNQKGYKMKSLGIGSPGTISQPSGKVTDASPNIKDWQGTILTKLFGNINIPVYGDNDANCVALAEYLVGYKRRYKNMVFITVGTGIGGGLIINGNLHRGHDYAAAEIGHTIIRHNGRLCKCGRRGCLEAYASVPNMMKQFQFWARKSGYKFDTKINPLGLFELYKNGNQTALKTIKENADYLGAGLGSIVNVLNPQVVIIGGGFSDSGEQYLKLVKESIRKYAFKAAVSRLKILKAKLGNKAGFVGASLLALVDENGRIKAK